MQVVKWAERISMHALETSTCGMWMKSWANLYWLTWSEPWDPRGSALGKQNLSPGSEYDCWQCIPKTINNSFLLQDDCSLRLVPYKDLLFVKIISKYLHQNQPYTINLYPHSVIHIKCADFPGYCWCAFTRTHSPPDLRSMCLSLLNSLYLSKSHSLKCAGHSTHNSLTYIAVVRF